MGAPIAVVSERPPDTDTIHDVVRRREPEPQRMTQAPVARGMIPPVDTPPPRTAAPAAAVARAVLGRFQG
jgi:hypothetical protein